MLNISHICAHAPHGEKDDKGKEKMYEQLERLYDICSSHAIKIALVDFNTQIGKELEFMTTTGNHSLHVRTNDNGESLV